MVQRYTKQRTWYVEKTSFARCSDFSGLCARVFQLETTAFRKTSTCIEDAHIQLYTYASGDEATTNNLYLCSHIHRTNGINCATSEFRYYRAINEMICSIANALIICFVTYWRYSNWRVTINPCIAWDGIACDNCADVFVDYACLIYCSVPCRRTRCQGAFPEKMVTDVITQGAKVKEGYIRSKKTWTVYVNGRGHKVINLQPCCLDNTITILLSYSFVCPQREKLDTFYMIIDPLVVVIFPLLIGMMFECPSLCPTRVLTSKFHFPKVIAVPDTPRFVIVRNWDQEWWDVVPVKAASLVSPTQVVQCTNQLCQLSWEFHGFSTRPLLRYHRLMKLWRKNTG